MIHGRLTSRAQTTIPRAVRYALGLREGDGVRRSDGGTLIN
jgi:bifunctional DNA-binding transcriptional regulator/antitoxin component of YhaV-PrlF toxin-antitoxin module